MSGHICPVVKLGKPTPIVGADKIEVFEIIGNGPVICVKGDYKEGDLATFIPPESCVSTGISGFEFLKKTARKSDGWAKIKPVRLRGQLSVGLLVPALGPEGSNGAEKYRVKKFEEHIKIESPKAKPVPFFRKLWLKITGRWSEESRKMWTGIPVYDINQLWKMRAGLFGDDELMLVTEKLHGTNARYVIGKDDRLWCGSRTMWRMHPGTSVYSRVATELGLESKLRRLREPLVLWGEIVGDTIQKCFDYGVGAGKIQFYCFDIYHAAERRFLDPSETNNICHWLDIQQVPKLAIDHWKSLKNELMAFAQAPSHFKCDHPREGIVVRPYKDVKETHALDGGRCLLAGKVINPAYLEFREKPGMDENIIL